MAAGSAIGTGIGAVIGSAIPGIGTAVGAGVGGALGGGIDAIIANNKAKDAANKIQEVDPNVVKFLEEARAQQRAYKTGSAAGYYKSQISENASSAKEGAIQLAGGNTGLAIAALGNITKASGEAVNQSLAELEKNNQFNTTLVGQLINDIAQRKLEVREQFLAQANADKASAMSSINNSINALIYAAVNKQGGAGGGDGAKTGGFNFPDIFGKNKGMNTKGIIDAPVTIPNVGGSLDPALGEGIASIAAGGAIPLV